MFYRKKIKSLEVQILQIELKNQTQYQHFLNLQGSLEKIIDSYYYNRIVIHKPTGEKKRIVSTRLINGQLNVIAQHPNPHSFCTPSFFTYSNYELMNDYKLTDEKMEEKTDLIVKDIEKMLFNLNVSSSISFLDLEKRVKELDKKLSTLTKKPINKLKK